MQGVCWWGPLLGSVLLLIKRIFWGASPEERVSDFSSVLAFCLPDGEGLCTHHRPRQPRRVSLTPRRLHVPSQTLEHPARNRLPQKLVRMGVCLFLFKGLDFPLLSFGTFPISPESLRNKDHICTLSCYPWACLELGAPLFSAH